MRNTMYILHHLTSHVYFYNLIVSVIVMQRANINKCYGDDDVTFKMLKLPLTAV